ncbi:DUF488 domain-containing protein [Ahrensia kielensis]|uniref:DUF488 domain-containing protein n=1 Tax=Ahrensia kielensis TaxID=76980 RepID=A0ABU9T512_9HYPH
MVKATSILSIGHSTLNYETFVKRLKSADVTAIADVRSSPFSRHLPHFNQDVLKDALAQDGIAYVFLGQELGGRPQGEKYYTDGIADYEKMATASSFKEGISRVKEGSQKYNIAMMCSEHNPLDCHRCLLVGRALIEQDYDVNHILSNGDTIGHRKIEKQLLSMLGKEEKDMFASPEELKCDAYRERAKKVAFTKIKRPPNTVAAE